MSYINGETKVIGFFGSAYKESKVYNLYNEAFLALHLNYIYVPFIVDDLEKAVIGIRNLGIHALGITMPYKEAIMCYLDEIDDNAKRIGAVNVVINTNGKLIGGNTDGHGAVRALKEKTSVQGKKVLVLGAGGAARAIAFAIYDEGGDLTVLNRNAEKAKSLANDIGEAVKFGSFDETESILSNTEILIHTTPIGMAETKQQSLVKKSFLQPNTVVMDIITNPTETRLLQDALAQGCEVVYGKRMLLWQAVEKFEWYTGEKAPFEVMEKAFEF